MLIASCADDVVICRNAMDVLYGGEGDIQSESCAKVILTRSKALWTPSIHPSSVRCGGHQTLDLGDWS